jgi:LruC domain-containing protein
LISNGSNGAESGQTKATVVAFDNVYNVMPNTSGASFVNTIIGNAKVAPKTVSNLISFTQPQQQLNVGLPPYNAFIFANGDRGREIHLANKAPTDLADQSAFGSADDDSDPTAERFYKTANGLPWAIHINGQFDYPQEYQPIDDAYLNFAPWASSGGTTFTDWFSDAVGYRDNSKIYY